MQETVIIQELITLLEHLSSPPVFSGVRVTRSLVLCICFVDRCLSFCPSSIYGFWLPLSYLQALLRLTAYSKKRCIQCYYDKTAPTLSRVIRLLLYLHFPSLVCLFDICVVVVWIMSYVSNVVKSMATVCLDNVTLKLNVININNNTISIINP